MGKLPTTCLRMQSHAITDAGFSTVELFKCRSFTKDFLWCGNTPFNKVKQLLPPLL